MDGVSDAASLVALFQLATNVIAYVKNVTDAPTQRRKLLVALLQARGLLSTLIDLTNECDEEDWSRTIQSLSIDNGPLSTFRDILSQLAGKLGIVTTRSNISAALNRLRWPFDQPSLQEMIDSLEKLKSHFLIAIANDHVRLSMAIRDEVYAVHRQLHTVIKDSQKRAIASLSREQELIVKSLSSVELSGELKGDEIMKLRASAEWFLLHDDFQRWHKTSPTSPNKEALVLIGLPGSGKSSICQVTRFFLKAWHQSDIDIASAYFSFRYSQREKQKESLVLSNIVQQLVLERPYLIEHITALKATGGPFSSSEGIDFICRARRDLKGLYLILDGLDESQTVGKALVEDLLAIEPPLSILVTARAHAVPDILRTLESCVLLNMNDAAMSSANIETVIQMLEKEPRIAGYLEYDSEAIADAARLIVERSEGL
jgi:hypothetical protein